mmetsp:Transcript_8233/g.20402  ORF Transcript_8233/g.20402 Transcript_8233/m.20402 type:complete len:140 (+) Transcript_8233:889-1308(+)
MPAQAESGSFLVKAAYMEQANLVETGFERSMSRSSSITGKRRCLSSAAGDRRFTRNTSAGHLLQSQVGLGSKILSERTIMHGSQRQNWQIIRSCMYIKALTMHPAWDERREQASKAGILIRHGHGEHGRDLLICTQDCI